MWGVQGTLQAPHLSAATGLRLTSPASCRKVLERVASRVGQRATPGYGSVLVVECKEEGVRYGLVDALLLSVNYADLKESFCLCNKCCL